MNKTSRNSESSALKWHLNIKMRNLRFSGRAESRNLLWETPQVNQIQLCKCRWIAPHKQHNWVNPEQLQHIRVHSWMLSRIIKFIVQCPLKHYQTRGTWACIACKRCLVATTAKHTKCGLLRPAFPYRWIGSSPTFTVKICCGYWPYKWISD